MKRFSLALALAFGLASTGALARNTEPISALPSASVPLTGDEDVPIVQSGVTSRAPAAAFGVPVSQATAPAPVADFQMWIDTSSAPNTLKMYDGADWVSLGTIDATGHLWLSADTRVLGAAQKAANLSDLASLATARTNLGAISASSADTLSNKTIDGGSNTLTNLPAANLTGTVPAGTLPLGPGLQVVGSAVQAAGGAGPEIAAPAVLTLTAANCPSVILGSTINQSQVTLPPVPPTGCEISLLPGLAGMLAISTGPAIWLPGYGGHPISQLAVPFVQQNGYVSLRFDGTVWLLGGADALQYEALNPLGDPLLAHGQVYLTLNGANFQLCPKNGPGGLIIKGQMTQIPALCLTLPDTGLTASTLYYLYAGQDLAHVPTGAANNGAGLVRLTIPAAAKPGTQVAVNCHSIAGTLEANGRFKATAIDTNSDGATDALDLTGSVFADAFAASPNAKCRITYLYASTDAHANSGGVEIDSVPGAIGTLAGMAWIDGQGLPHDTPTQRDVAGWYNPHLKTCKNALTSNVTTTSTGWADMAPSNHCEFVTFGRNATAWNINGGASMSNSQGALGAGFDGITPETEQTGVGHSAGTGISPSGSATLTEGKHYATILATAATSGGTLTVSGSVPATSISVGVWQ